MDQRVQQCFFVCSIKKADVSLKVYVSFLSGCSHSRAGMSLFKVTLYRGT